jgi:hypothetical protein
MRTALTSLVFMLLALTGVSAVDHWPQFRGTQAGVADDDAALPDIFDLSSPSAFAPVGMTMLANPIPLRAQLDVSGSVESTTAVQYGVSALSYYDTPRHRGTEAQRSFFVGGLCGAMA